MTSYKLERLCEFDYQYSFCLAGGPQSVPCYFSCICASSLFCTCVDFCGLSTVQVHALEPNITQLTSGSYHQVPEQTSALVDVMTFVSSYLLGLFFGVAAVVSFLKAQRRKSRTRMQKAVETAMLRVMNKDDLSKLLPKALLPSWVQFQDFERVRWLNMQLRDLWPHINKATQESIIDHVEPLLEDYLPSMFASFSFRKLTLGTVPPEVEGIQVVNSSDQDRVELLVQFKCAGNPSIILGITTVFGTFLTIQLKDFRIWGRLRIVLAPLVDVLPCFGTLSASLTEKPTIDYSIKVSGADIDTFPGLRSQIDALIHDAINDRLVWPARVLVPILPGDYSDMEMHETAMLDVNLVEARINDEGLRLANVVEKAVTKAATGKVLQGTLNPFARLYIRRARGRIQESFHASQTSSPLWGQSFQMFLEDKESQRLTVELWNEGEFSQAKLGVAVLPLKDVPVLDVEDLWLDVKLDAPEEGDKAVVVGRVHLELVFRPLDAQGVPLGDDDYFTEGAAEQQGTTPVRYAAASGSPAPQRPIGPTKHGYIRGVITVTLTRGINLISRDSNGLSDPFCLVYCLKVPDTRKKTKVIFKTLNPEWGQTFELLVEDAKNDMLVVQVYDHDLLGMKDVMGWCAVTFTKVIRKKVIEGEFELEGGGGGRIEMRLEWTRVL